MKVLTRKSRTAILIFLSIVTLTLVAHISIARPYASRDLNLKQLSAIAYKSSQTKRAESENQLLTGIKLTPLSKQLLNTQTIIAFRPWTALASPRSPPV